MQEPDSPMCASMGSSLSASAQHTPRNGKPKAGLAGLRSIPARIRALAKAIHDDRQFDELRVPNTGEIRKAEALNLLQQLGANLSDDELILFDVALAEYSQQLEGVNPNLVKREAVSNVLTLTASIDADAAFAGVSLPTTMDAVVRAHAVYMRFMNTVFPASGVDAFTAYSDAVTRQLTILSEVTKKVAARRATRFRSTEEPTVRVANARLWSVVYVVERVVPAILMTVLFDAHTVVDDKGAQDAWDSVAGRTSCIIPASKAAALFEGYPPTIADALVGLMDVGGIGYVTVFSFADVVRIWGPYVILAQNFYRDIISGCFCLYVTPVEAELHLRGALQLYAATDAGDRRRWGEAAHVKGSVAEAKYLEAAENEMKPTAGNFCICVATEPGHLNIQVLDATLTPVIYDLYRDCGAWQIQGLSRQHFETIHDACESYRQVFRRAVGNDASVVWPSDQPKPVDTACHALHRACFCRNLPFVNHLLRTGSEVVVNVAMADAVLVPSEFMWPPLLFAVNSPCGDPHEIVARLIEAGADVTFVDEAGCTALYYAIALGYRETVKLLLKEAPGLPSSLTTDRMLMALGAHHFLANEDDVRRLSIAQLHPELVEHLLHFEDDMDFILLCAAIVDGKIRGEPLRPDQRLDVHAAEGRLSHLNSRTIVTEEHQRVVDAMVAEHSERSRRDTSARRTALVLQHKLFKLSVEAHLQSLRRAPTEAGSSQASSIRETSPVALGASQSPAFHTSTPDLKTSQGRLSVSRNTRRVSISEEFSDEPSLNMSVSPRAVRRRRSSLALSYEAPEESVLLTPAELVAMRRRFSIISSDGGGSAQSGSFMPPRVLHVTEVMHESRTEQQQTPDDEEERE